jgi:hypothetical protein
MLAWVAGPGHADVARAGAALAAAMLALIDANCVAAASDFGMIICLGLGLFGGNDDIDRLERLDTELGAERVRQPPRQHRAAYPVHDHYQVEEAFGHREGSGRNARLWASLGPLGRQHLDTHGEDLVSTDHQ